MASQVTFVTGTAEVRRREHNGLDSPERTRVRLVDGKCDCCPYGYHIDLDFINFCESINSGSTLKQLKKIQRAKRKLRKSMEIMLHQQDQARLHESGTPPPDVVHNTEASRLMHMVEYEQSSTHRILDEIDSSVDQTIAHIDHMMKPSRKQQRYFSSDSEDGYSPVSPNRYNTFPLRKSVNGDESSHFATSLSTSGRTDSMSSLSSVSTVSSENPQGQIIMTQGQGSNFVHTTATAEVAHQHHTTSHKSQRYYAVTSAQLAETMAAHFPHPDREGATSPYSTTTSISKSSLSAIREAMAMSLQRMKELEEQVKALPILQVRISVLKEEKRLLMLQLRARNTTIDTRSVGVGEQNVYKVSVKAESPQSHTYVFAELASPGPVSPRVSTPLKTPPPTLPKPKKSRSIGIGDHSVVEPYLLQTHLSTGYTIRENEVQSEIRSLVMERETLFKERSRFEPNTHITINQIQRGSPKALTRSIGVGEGNVFDNSGLHIHEKELRTVIIGQTGNVGKRNVGVECRVPTRDVGVSYVCDDEKPSTRTVGVNVDTGSILTSLSFKGEELRGALREVLSKSVRSIGTNCNFKPMMDDAATICDQIRTVTLGVGDHRVDVEVRPHQIMKSIAVGFHPEMHSRYANTDKGWMLDQGTNTPMVDRRHKSTSTDKPRAVHGSTSTDATPVRSGGSQTDIKVFYATDQVKNAGSNTQKKFTSNVAVNTETKLMQSDTFDYSITFQDQSENTMFSVADQAVNTERGQYAVKTSPTRSKSIGVSEDRIDTSGGYSNSSSEQRQSSVDVVTTTKRSSSGSYAPVDMSKFMMVEGGSSKSKQSSSSTKRRSVESPKQRPEEFEEYRYSEESYIVRGNDLEHGEFDIVRDLGGTEKRIVTKKTDMPIDKVLGVENRKKRMHTHPSGEGEGEGYIRYVKGENAQSQETESDESSRHHTSSTSHHVVREYGPSVVSGVQMRTSLEGNYKPSDRGSRHSSGGSSDVQDKTSLEGDFNVMQSSITSGYGSLDRASRRSRNADSQDKMSTEADAKMMQSSYSSDYGSLDRASRRSGGRSMTSSFQETVTSGSESQMGSSGRYGSLEQDSRHITGGLSGTSSSQEKVSSENEFRTSSSDGYGSLERGSRRTMGGKSYEMLSGSQMKSSLEGDFQSKSSEGFGSLERSSRRISGGSTGSYDGDSRSGSMGGSNTFQSKSSGGFGSLERSSRRTSGGSAGSYDDDSRSGSTGGNSTVTTVEETVVQKKTSGGPTSPLHLDTSGFGTSGDADDVSPTRFHRRPLFQPSTGIDNIAGFQLSTSPTRLSAGSFTSDSGSLSPDGSRKSVMTHTVTTTRQGGETVTVEENTRTEGGRVTSSSTTVTGDPDLLQQGEQQSQQQVSMLKSELSSLSGNLASQREFNHGLGIEQDQTKVSSSHSSVNTSFDSENGTLKSIMKRSKSDNQVKKGISFASTVVGGTDSEGSTEGESENEEGNASDSSYEEGSYDGRQGSIVYQCKDDEAIAKGVPGAKMFDQNIRQTFELSEEIRQACDVLANYLVDSTTVRTSQLNSNLNKIQKVWFDVAGQKLSDPYQVEDYMSSFNEISKRTLEYVVNMADTNGNTALHYAVSNCNFDVVSLFLDSGVIDVNKQNKAGYTPVMLASLAYVQTQDQIDAVRRLFRTGDVNLCSSQAGQTALMLAVSHGRTNMVEMLLDAGASVNLRDDDGSTALMCACEHGHNDIVKLLLAHPGTDANITDNDGSTAFSIAMEAGHKDVGVVLYAHLNFTKSSPGLVRKRKSSSSPTPSRFSR